MKSSLGLRTLAAKEQTVAEQKRTAESKKNERKIKPTNNTDQRSTTAINSKNACAHIII